MSFVSLRGLLVTLLLGLLAACGGGNSTETTVTGGGSTGSAAGPVVSLSEPSGANTLAIVVDTGPATGFALGVANLPYVSVTVCAPGSTTQCTTIDHVFLDTGSVGFRVLRSAVASLGLPAMTTGTGAATTTTTECYPFVVGAVWGPMARADVRLGSETAAALPIQLIDDSATLAAPVPADCQKAANGDLLNSASKLQAKGVLGIGMLRYDCGLRCEQGNYTGGYTLYYGCTAAGNCQPQAVLADAQTQNPVSSLPVNNNGTLIVMPSVPDTGAQAAHGRLVLGIGTQANNQLPVSAPLLRVETNPALDNYLYLSTTVGSTSYPNSYVDSGSNGLFFDDASLPLNCAGSGAGASWFCPAAPVNRNAVIRDGFGNSVTLSFQVANTDRLFATSNVAFANLAGSAGGAANPGAFVWGMPFFYGRSVYTSIWGQALAVNGPWVAF